MGIVASQSFKNIISTYIGFVVGAINTLFLYVNFMSDTYYGMVGFMLSAAYVLMPLMAFGVHNTLVKFYTSFKTRLSLNSFLTLMLLLPMAIAIPVGIIGYFGYNIIGEFLSSENPMIKGYLWHTFFISIALAYFEVFYAWVKVEFQTVFGNFMKEVFHRVGAMVILFLLYFETITIEQFMVALVVVYVLRMLVMMLYAFSVKLPVIVFKKVNNIRSILKYSFLIIIAGSIATVLLDVDKVMLGKYVPIKNVAYYNVAIFIAAVIAVPQRAMHQILLPLSAKYLNEKDMVRLADLYKRSSLNLFIVTGFIFLLIVLNIKQLYTLISPEYSVGLYVVLLISVAKLYDALLGSNNAILFNSEYYRIVLMLGVILVIIMVLLNILLIPLYGLNGAALATFIAILLYNTLKLIVVYRVFKITPFSDNTLKVAALLLLFGVFGYFWDFNFHAIINIILKSVLVVTAFSAIVYRSNFSPDINDIIQKNWTQFKK
ncbi:Membrane protein involved in the export of O-antigen and teichoic acid [Hyunsoonleella jejuensis]|uniref:Membrane protein involved in the export of O-antigen and teichoic acid n=1 Tax=Hyunsoonleella jejuensis TaxID=419940 RepID=A0A1H9GAG7_9FLAO|nr:polysaccharide biosynthesis C-terminal domain-containing protein [Hyunsoonleella jejuensis]SEQ47003.1 Membrane protein involved in the export of O-antigen and teichoic acid [Hyunsoonleella jejuensis]